MYLTAAPLLWSPPYHLPYSCRGALSPECYLSFRPSSLMILGLHGLCPAILVVPHYPPEVTRSFAIQLYTQPDLYGCITRPPSVLCGNRHIFVSQHRKHCSRDYLEALSCLYKCSCNCITSKRIPLLVGQVRGESCSCLRSVDASFV